MDTQKETNQEVADSAAVLGAALSLWQACLKPLPCDPPINLSECYQGGDQWMREVMRVATLFEVWATKHIVFEQTDEVWPYFLEERFGRACVAEVGAAGLAEFGDADCLRVALRLRLPIKCVGPLVAPLVLSVVNPVPGAGFPKFRIQTMRSSSEGEVVPLTEPDDMFDEEYGPPFFGLYGVAEEGQFEHIADRRTYAEARGLALKLAPGIEFPEVAVVSYPNKELRAKFSTQATRSREAR